MNERSRLFSDEGDMADKKQDRRVQRTRELLRNALMQLIQEKGYDAITIEEITDRANLGRTTFYLHYQNKDDLLLDHHAEFTSQLNLDRLSREQLLGDEPQPEMVEFLQQISQGKAVYLAFTQARDADIIIRNIRQHLINNLLASLQEAFPDTVPDPPVDILAQYLVRAQLSLIDWWITNRTGYDAELMAATLHRLQSTAVRDAYGKQM
jgi:AcrR family transcriptional regulator